MLFEIFEKRKQKISKKKKLNNKAIKCESLNKKLKCNIT